ncbi:Ubiquitin-conjugating enzyme E2 [Trinorchestia longiramus]|nr:Ubiquitin-conjugating enzyme E2 [Trinorchestia longiramus]
MKQWFITRFNQKQSIRMAYQAEPPLFKKVIQHPIDNNMVPGVSPQICPFQSPDWDDQNLSRRALLRCKAEINTIAKQPAPDVYIFNDEEKINCFKVLLIGPEGTPYEGGFFHFFARRRRVQQFEDMGLKDVWLYDMYVRHETLRVTVVEGLRTWETYDIPAKLVRHMVANFFEHYDSYIAACHTFKTYDGTSFQTCMVAEVFKPNFTRILQDLIKLHAELLPFKDKIFCS